MKKSILYRLISFAVPAAALSIMTGSVMADEIVCKSGNTQRIISVDYERSNSPVPCRVKYEKPDEGGTVDYPWNAQGQPGYCEEKAGVLASKLEGWGWTCNINESSRRVNSLNM